MEVSRLKPPDVNPIDEEFTAVKIYDAEENVGECRLA